MSSLNLWNADVNPKALFLQQVSRNSLVMFHYPYGLIYQVMSRDEVKVSCSLVIFFANTVLIINSPSREPFHNFSFVHDYPI